MRTRCRSTPGSSASPNTGAIMIHATGRISSTLSPSAAIPSFRWWRMAWGQKSWMMMRSPFSAWYSTEKKMASSPSRNTGWR
ncbi:MAG: hypothetical protein AVDCRST_MAG68-1948 [uncultured Gemmatimonadetes bacterium]|uniref:Uncharacterized protein n=1 Tax=uncultured Gemmatimonadota bacterium TaxID=203437 RepID=A0A6J4L2U9_9BACT|nr:MAG: hypothetical protein AVDCRST_MAG68-1948 [uncultured Gemmatimonadota bacterium]